MLKKFDRTSMALEDAFFLKKDTELIEQRRKLEKMEHTRKALTAASGITNKILLDKLIALDISPQTLSAMTMIPLVEVAWADGKICSEEKLAVMEAAEKNGIKSGSIDHDLLESWLKHRPTKKLMDVWRHYIEELNAQMTLTQRAALRKDLMGRARKVAKATGGLLGLAFKISPREEAILQEMEQAFQIRKG